MMIFDDSQSISKQLLGYCCACISSGQWLPGSRIPSTKDLSLQMGVNPRTVMKVYDELAAAGIISQKRGMGYYTATDAAGRVLERRRSDFIRNTIPALRAMMKELSLTTDELISILNNEVPATSDNKN